MFRSNLVYKFKCNICNDIYYGKTIRHFPVRACEHLGITPLTEKKTESPVFDHIVHTGHSASFDEFETLVKGCDEFRILLRESPDKIVDYRQKFDLSKSLLPEISMVSKNRAINQISGIRNYGKVKCFDENA